MKNNNHFSRYLFDIIESTLAKYVEKLIKKELTTESIFFLLQTKETISL